MSNEIKKIVEAVKSGESSARAEVEAAIKRAEADDSNAILEIIRDRALERADEIDVKIKAGESVGKLVGVPFVAKDNFLTLGSKTTAASKILANFEAPLQATAIEKLENEGAICIGKANLDSFAHGGSTENSAYGVTHNAIDDERVAGGSSGGSAVAVARGIVPFALGSDTGGSIRQPASFNGVIGYKPTYGMISRYGVVAMASSTDVVGPITKTVEDARLLCEIMAGQDERDSTVFSNYISKKQDKILFVCWANVGRSQTAKLIYRILTGTENADAAGVGVEKEQPNGTTMRKRDEILGYELGVNDYQSTSRAFLQQEYDTDVSDWPRAQLTPEMIDEYKLVINIAERFQTPSWLRGDNVIWWDIKDPGLKKDRELKTKALREASKDLTIRIKRLIEIEKNNSDFRQIDDKIDDENISASQSQKPHFQSTENPPRPDKEFTTRNFISVFVYDEKNDKYLAVKWKKFPWISLVGGGIDDGEDVVDAARREVLEETGYKNLKLARILGEYTSEFYAANKDVNRMISATHVLFTLENDEQDELADAEKVIQEPVWLSRDEFKREYMPAYDETMQGFRWIDELSYNPVKSNSSKKKIGLIKEFMDDGVDPAVRDRINEFARKLRASGHEVEEISLSMAKYALPIYYIVTPAEISSNLARYDGIRYGERSKTAKTLAEIYGQSRDQGFVDENKRRIMIGSYVLSAGFFDAYYLQAQKARTLLINQFNDLFKDYDFLVGPVSATPAYKIGENINDPIKMYLSDLMTAPASLAGLPAISLPIGESDTGLPIGVQIIGQMKSDNELLNFAESME